MKKTLILIGLTLILGMSWAVKAQDNTPVWAKEQLTTQYISR